MAAALDHLAKTLDDGFLVRYAVEQRSVEPVRQYGYAHIGTSQVPVLPYWSGEHARQHGKRYDLTSTSKTAAFIDDPDARARVFDGQRGFKRFLNQGTVEYFPAGSAGEENLQLLPEEELYRELLGFESLRRKVGISFQGSRTNRAYDLTTLVQDSDTQLSWTSLPARAGRVVLLEVPGLDRAWLGADLGYATLRRERHWDAGQPLRAVFENSDFQALSDGLFLPHQSQISYYGHPQEADRGQVVVEAVLRVQEASLQLPAKLFDADFLQDTLVVNAATQLGGRLPELNGAKLEDFLASPDTFRPAATNRTWGLGGMFVAANVLLLVTVLAFFAYRRWWGAARS